MALGLVPQEDWMDDEPNPEPSQEGQENDDQGTRGKRCKDMCYGTIILVCSMLLVAVIAFFLGWAAHRTKIYS